MRARLHALEVLGDELDGPFLALIEKLPHHVREINVHLVPAQIQLGVRHLSKQTQQRNSSC